MKKEDDASIQEEAPMKKGDDASSQFELDLDALQLKEFVPDDEFGWGT